ncbi:MAG TPA: FtsX-like permease family protein [Vicinamibacterales bacterium]|nr:FtsX-like permease family protein [Vicinamibacterales bacterium]
MKYLPLIWKNIWRRKFLTLVTLAVVFVSFLLFGLLMTIRTAFSLGVELAGQDRLVLIHKVSLIQPLPVAYQGRLATVPGVEIVTHNSWFGGIYQDPSNFFAQIAVEPEPFLEIYKEIHLPPDQVKAWLADRQGAIVGVDLARRFNFKIGDRIPIQGTIWRPKSGTGDTWEFNVVGIYDAEPGFDKTQLFFRYDYLDENRQFGEGLVGWYIVKIADPSQSTSLAQRFDEMFANSQAETKTTTEKGFIDSFAKQIGDIGSIVVSVVTVVMFIMLLIVTIVMVYLIDQRTNELAVLKTLGFTNVAVVTLVLIESVFVAVLGGGLGLGAAWLIVQAGDPTNGMMPTWTLLPRDLGVGFGLMLVLGFLAGALPASYAMRLKIVDALRRH